MTNFPHVHVTIGNNDNIGQICRSTQCLDITVHIHSAPKTLNVVSEITRHQNIVEFNPLKGRDRDVNWLQFAIQI